jgi:hypothetical protein
LRIKNEELRMKKEDTPPNPLLIEGGFKKLGKTLPL